LQYANIGRFLTSKPIHIDRFWRFGGTYYDKNSRKYSVPLYYVLEKIIPLRLEEREKKRLHSISITSNIWLLPSVPGFRLVTLRSGVPILPFR